ncbi:MerR family transcriptional regulator [Clostridium felsineum]|uniref:MerR family transcriptional regulator n=1 Tax=Clostridium felsineum TaxID=36839 RepID=UPI00098BDF4F|nr:MerR family transcriptional regulator [Clostridium felsineum]URZ17499.1 putative HTH-type transcriptional regulator [Clostridium felsineum DSM 794]
MSYSIGEVAQKLNLSTSTLRYYDKEGLLPFVKRNSSGIRTFSDEDLKSLHIIECLKNTNMPIKDIKTFIDWCSKGDSTLEERYNMFIERRKIVEEQMANLKHTLETIDYKCWYYKTALDAGTEKIHKSIPSKDTIKNNASA